MTLTKSQKEFLLKLVAEGLESDEINARARKFKAPFDVSRQQVDHYRKSRGVMMKEIVASDEMDALCTGLSIKEARVEILQEVMTKLLRRVRASDDFDEPTYRQLRGLLDDLAKETGGRKAGVEHSGKVSGAMRVSVVYEDDKVEHEDD
ncbi:MAG: hypothetical protein M3458_14840 [Acidobacteriota bacterium]|nr:hypothetical protein [Acidobacteriota bacterium]